MRDPYDQLVEICDEVGIDPESLSEKTWNRIECMCDYPDTQREILENILEEIESGA
jgi:hypothetical protein